MMVFSYMKVKVPRVVNRDKDGRGAVTELLIHGRKE